ncbi:hypothetical protein KKF32_03980 [Patescibacteria group bacterium]|nr:hypothetical protein [Patescibacteria group bacterium]
MNSSSVTTDENGDITSLTDYFPYGTDRVKINNSSLQNSYKFTDQESDIESGLYYYDARHYDADGIFYNFIFSNKKIPSD